MWKTLDQFTFLISNHVYSKHELFAIDITLIVHEILFNFVHY